MAFGHARLRILAATIVLLGFSAKAQSFLSFRPVASDYSGRSILFLSYGRLSGTTEKPYPGIFGATDGTVSFVADWDSARLGGVGGPQMNDDGGLQAYSSYYEGIGHPYGSLHPWYFWGTVHHARDGWTIRRDGQVRLSREGRWAVFTSTSPARTTWLDLWTGEEFSKPTSPEPVGSVADDGSVVFTAYPNALLLQRPFAEAVDIPLSFQPSTAMIERNSRYAAVSGASQIWRVELPRGQAEIWVPNCTPCSLVDIASNGSGLLFLTNSKLYYQGEPGSTPAAIPDTLYASFTGNSQAIVYSNSQGVFRRDLASGTVEKILDGPAVLPSPVGDVAPGMWIRTVGQVPQNARVTVNGQEVVQSNNASGGIDWVVPENTPLGTAEMQIGNPASPFLPCTQILQVLAIRPRFIYQREASPPGEFYDWPHLAHASDGSPVSTTNPTKPGEHVIVYITGLNGQARSLRWMVGTPGDLAQVNAALISVTDDPDHPGWTRVELQLPDSLPQPIAELRVYADTANISGRLATAQ